MAYIIFDGAELLGNFDRGTKGQRRITNAHLALSNTHSVYLKRDDTFQSVLLMLYTPLELLLSIWSLVVHYIKNTKVIPH